MNKGCINSMHGQQLQALGYAVREMSMHGNRTTTNFPTKPHKKESEKKKKKNTSFDNQ